MIGGSSTGDRFSFRDCLNSKIKSISHWMVSHHNEGDVKTSTYVNSMSGFY